ncbi:protein kinase [Streptomyces arenae]|uniref:protein kinase n=1 Tax=Streptomyces arenae TaxID=29301 RepID=UPI0026587577|nr:protein kinase [Streptomyces arenae]MCG7206348.1 protein kinase [Streptomyces arenae]
MDDYAGRVLADRYRLPLPPSDEYELTETRAFDTYSGQEVLVRQVPLPEVVEAEVLDAEGLPDGFTARDRGARRPPSARTATRRPSDPAVRRAVEAAQAAARIPDHPRLDQVFDVFAEGGSLWIVSEFVAARPLAALLAEQPLTPYRAAEVASDVLMALRVLHAHGWVHRNITARTVLVCDDGRVMLTGLAVGAAEEALSGYDPVPFPEGESDGEAGGERRAGPAEGSGTPGIAGALGVSPASPVSGGSGAAGALAVGGTGSIGGAFGGTGGAQTAPGASEVDPEAARRAAIQARAAGGLPGAGSDEGSGGAGTGAVERRALETGADVRAARAGAIAAYQAGARAAARVQEAQQNSRAALPGARPPADGDTAPYPPQLPYGAEQPDTEPRPPYTAGQANGAAQSPYGPGHADDAARPPYGQGPANGESQSPYTAGQANGAAQSPYGPGHADDAARPPYGQGPANGESQSPYTAGQANGAAQPPYIPGQAHGASQSPYGGGRGQGAEPGAEQRGAGGVPPGQIADPYGVRGAPAPWHGAAPRPQPGVSPGPQSDVSPGSQSGVFPRPQSGVSPRTQPGVSSALAGQERSALPSAAAAGAGLELPGVLPGALGGAQKQPHAVVPAQGTGAAPRWGEAGAAAPGRRGPATALAAERARQVRMTVVGPVTERWAPEQAVPVHENWQLAAPIGPATDLWALGALLFRAVQGHAPYPEESTAELVQLVCSEPPAFAEECGSLRPVVESLLRQDPTERLDFEELRGWLRSLVRSAPEPDAGTHVVTAPPADPRRLPIVRRRGELVRRRRAGLPATHGRHKRARQEAKSPRRLGRTLLLLILLLLAAAVAYAMLFLPKKTDTDDTGERTGSAGSVSTTPSSRPSATPTPTPTAAPSTETQTTAGSTGGAPAGDGFTLRDDPDGFRIAVAKGWSRTPRNGSGQVIYSHGKFELIVVAGRDSAATYGSDPMTYQRDKEPELQPYRDSSWATAGGLRTITVGQQVSAEGQFTWTDSSQGDLFVRNMVFLIGGRYHIVQVRGPESERDEVTKLYEQASTTYKYTG